VFPKLGVDVVYDDNIRAVEKDSPVYRDDTFFFIKPEVKIESDWSRHELNAGALARIARYDESDNLDFEDYEVWVDGGLNMRDSKLTAKARSSRLNEPLSSPNFRPNALSPTRYDKNDLGLRYRFAPNRFFAQLQLDWTRLDFKPQTVIILDEAGNPRGTEVSNDDRDRDLTQIRLRTGYKVSPGAGVFVEGRYFDIDYRIKDPDQIRNRILQDQDGYDLVVGSELDLSGVTVGEFYVGYRNIDYASRRFESQDGLLIGASIDWNITRLTTITLGVDQRLRGSTVDGINDSPPPPTIASSGIQELLFSLAADHELRRNIILTLELQSRNEDFLNITREDDVFSARFGAEYSLNRRWGINAGYIYQERDSNYKNSPDFNVQTFEINRLYLGVVGKI
jgi:hypothetical protein